MYLTKRLASSHFTLHRTQDALSTMEARGTHLVRTRIFFRLLLTLRRCWRVFHTQRSKRPFDLLSATQDNKHVLSLKELGFEKLVAKILQFAVVAVIFQ
jgi:hypothetical protein